jgi:hydrogenase nickel incorporation protein HypA/HybF
MHELSIAQGIFENLRPWLDSRGDLIKIGKIIICAGPMRAVNPEALIGAWEIVRIGHTKMNESFLEIDPSFIQVKCKKCGGSWNAERAVFKCELCGSDQLELGGGNELFIESIETFSE